MEAKAPKDLIKEYETPEGGKVREVGPIVYGYSMTIGPDGKPKGIWKRQVSHENRSI